MTKQAMIAIMEKAVIADDWNAARDVIKALRANDLMVELNNTTCEDWACDIMVAQSSHTWWAASVVRGKTMTEALLNALAEVAQDVIEDNETDAREEWFGAEQ